MRRRIAVGTVLVSGAVLLAACSSSSAPPKPTTTTSTTTPPTTAAPTTTTPTSVTIALEGPISGSQGSTGQDMLRGAQLAAANLNAAGGVLGKQIVISPLDDAAEASKGVTVAQQAVAAHVAGVVGPFNSSVGVEALPIYRGAGIPIVRLTSAASTQGFGVTTQPMQGQIAPVEAQEISGVLKAKSVAIVYDPSTFTSAVAAQLRQLLAKDAVGVPVFRSLSPTASPAATTAALAAVSAVHPSVTYLAMYGPQAAQVVTAMNGAAPYGTCFLDLAAQGSDFTSAVGAKAAGCLASGVPSPGQLPSTSAPTYISQYQATFKTTPETWGPFAYDSVELLAQAAMKAGSWTNAPVAAQLAKITGYQGVTGSITIEPVTGNRVNPPVVILGITGNGVYGVNAAWAAFAGYKGPFTPTTTTAPPPTTTTTAPVTTTTNNLVPKWKGKTIPLGAIFSTTGIGQPYGTSQTDGANLAVSQIDAAGGIFGAKLSLSIVDDQSTPATATTQMSAFGTQGVMAVLGPTFTNSALVADPIANQMGFPVLGVSNTGQGIVGNCAAPCPWSFRDSLGEATAVPANVNTYVAASHPTTAVVLYAQSDTYAQQTAAIAAAAFQSNGNGVTNPQTIPVPTTEPALGTAVTAALASKPSVAMMIASSPTVVAAMINDARNGGYAGGILGANSFNSPSTAKAAGKNGKGAQSGAAWYSGNTTKENTSFITAYEAKYQKAPDQYAAQAYTGVLLLAAAARAAPLTFTNLAADRSALAGALAAVSLTTPLGRFSFTPQHDVVQPVWVLAMNGLGGYTLVKKVTPPTSQSPNSSTTSSTS